MNPESFVKVGKVKDAHGIKGELFLALFAGEAAWLGKLKSIRLVRDGMAEGQAPSADSIKTYTVKSVRFHKNGLIAKTHEIKDRNEAESLKGWLFEIPEEFLVSEKGEQIYLREIEGFRVFTKAKGEVGTITGFGNNVAQDLIVVKTAWGEFEIPFVEAFVERIEYGSKEIHLDLPEGLLGEDALDETDRDEVQ